MAVKTLVCSQLSQHLGKLTEEEWARCCGKCCVLERSGCTGSEGSLNEDPIAHLISKELPALSTQGFEVMDTNDVA